MENADKRESEIEEPVNEIDEPSSFIPSAHQNGTQGNNYPTFRLPFTQYKHAEKMDVNAIRLIVVFAVIITIALVASFFCATDKDNIMATVLDICKTVIIALLGYAFGSRTLKGGKGD